MRLSAFIDLAREQIVAESVRYAAGLPVLGGEALSILRDHLPLVLDSIARDLEQSQTRAQSITKSEGHGPTFAAETAASGGMRTSRTHRCSTIRCASMRPLTRPWRSPWRFTRPRPSAGAAYSSECWAMTCAGP